MIMGNVNSSVIDTRSNSELYKFYIDRGYSNVGFCKLKLDFSMHLRDTNNTEVHAKYKYIPDNEKLNELKGCGLKVSGCSCNPLQVVISNGTD